MTALTERLAVKEKAARRAVLVASNEVSTRLLDMATVLCLPVGSG
jgi:hypothetical protein